MPCGIAVLCGINSRFQLLFHCMRQVTHALLTRPPLNQMSFHPKTSLHKVPFDLHVLSTPPAFILSQDQTLMLKFLSFSELTLASLKRKAVRYLFTVFLGCKLSYNRFEIYFAVLIRSSIRKSIRLRRMRCRQLTFCSSFGSTVYIRFPSKNHSNVFDDFFLKSYAHSSIF